MKTFDECTKCKGPFSEPTGWILSERTKLCGRCAKNFADWTIRQLKRKWGRERFYDHIQTSREKT